MSDVIIFYIYSFLQKIIEIMEVKDKAFSDYSVVCIHLLSILPKTGID